LKNHKTLGSSSLDLVASSREQRLNHRAIILRSTHPLGEAALTKEYFDVMDPFVTLSAAAAGTAVCLVIQRDTIQTAKLVASLDQVSKGRFWRIEPT
jgi:alkanesulfonate monooxygenase SsuD/methylene tetrahydromethanopterin reductase-like flavin-dependent oxidoreductase (luciferase family)